MRLYPKDRQDWLVLPIMWASDPRDMPTLMGVWGGADLSIDDEEWEATLERFPKKYMRASDTAYDHGAVVRALEGFKHEERRDKWFRTQACSAAGTPEDMLVRRKFYLVGEFG